MIDLVPFFLQSTTQQTGHGLFIFYDQNLHGPLSITPNDALIAMLFWPIARSFVLYATHGRTPHQRERRLVDVDATTCWAAGIVARGAIDGRKLKLLHLARWLAWQAYAGAQWLRSNRVCGEEVAAAVC